MRCYQCCVLMSSFCDNHNMCTFNHTILYSTKVKQENYSQKLNKGKFNELIVIVGVGFKGEALREECW